MSSPVPPFNERCKNSLRTFFRQLWIMLKRNTKLQIRYRRSTIAQTIVGPIVFLLLLWVMQKADNYKKGRSNYHPTPYPLDGVAACQNAVPGGPCISIMFSPPDNGTVRKFMETFANYNGKRTGVTWNIENPITDLNVRPTTISGMVPIPDSTFMYNYALQNPNVTKFAVDFVISGPPVNVQYEIWLNSTLTKNNSDIFGGEVLSLVRTLDEAIITVLNDPSATTSTTMNITQKDWPKVPPTTFSDDIVTSLGAMFFFCSEMIIFISVLNTIVTEKELHLKHSMVMMGLQPIVYWLSWYISNALLVVICSLVTVVVGRGLNFTVFTQTDFFISLITFILFGLAMVSAAMAITAVSRQAKVAVLVGIFIFIIGLLFQSFVFSNTTLGYIWWDPSTDQAIWKVLIFLPFFNFGKIFALDMNTLTTGTYDTLTDSFITGPGFGWADLYKTVDSGSAVSISGTKPMPPPPIDSWNYFAMNIFVYLLLAMYLDQVVPDEYGTARKPWFLFTPEFWGFRKSGRRDPAVWLADVRKIGDKLESFDDEDPEIKKERQLAVNLELPTAVRIVNLRKVYRNSVFRESPLDKVAVKNTCLRLEEGKLLALLGGNGAGKTSTLSILSGLTPSTSGDALFDGYSIKHDMPMIRKMMGVCPQHDVLFADLTAREHIELYSGLKGIPRADIPGIMKDRLSAVRLWKVVDNCAGTYSGGMKRRLSMVISTLGDPKLIFMDEPTTGMDPVNRRHVWSFIEKFKKGRVIVLTTHSMEEADILGDRIAIMGHGRVRGLGTSIYLKNKFGAGYRFSLITLPEDTQAVKNIVSARVPGAILQDDSAGALIYQFPNEAVKYIPDFVRWIEEEDNGKQIKNFGISQTTLEEVFLSLIRASNPGGYSGYEKKRS